MPLSIQEFDVLEIVKAYHFMIRGNYFGKIVIYGLDSWKEFPVTSKKLPIQGENDTSVTPLVAMVPEDSKCFHENSNLFALFQCLFFC